MHAQTFPTYFYTCACWPILGPAQVSQSCNAAGTCEHDTGIFLSLEDAGETEDVRGLHEEAADDGRPQRPLCGPNACPGESRGGERKVRHRRTGKLLILWL